MPDTPEPPDDPQAPIPAAPVPPEELGTEAINHLYRAATEVPDELAATIPVSRSQASFPGASVPDLPLPEELSALLPKGDYVVDCFLGQGGMGAVYRGTQVRLQRPVAIKIMRRDQGRDYGFEERFRREALAMAKLNHPNIVSVIDYGEAGPDYLYIVMELVEGADLMDVIRTGRMTQDMAITLLPQICDALQFAHDNGIVHRDIKPSNIMLTRDGRVKMADFGLAKRYDVESSFRTQTGTGMGTPDYAAPEQFDPQAPIDHRADIYALGVMIYQMITGQLPRGVWKAPSERAEVEKSWDDIVNRAMQSDPKDRYPSANDLKTDVSRILTGSAKEKANRSTPSTVVAKKKAEQAAKAATGKKAALVLGTIAIIAFALSGVFWNRITGNVAFPDRADTSAAPVEARKDSTVAAGAGSVSPASIQKAGIDLLPYVDVKRDAVKGTWSVKPDGVFMESTEGLAVLELPYEPPEEYDVEVELTLIAGTYNANVYLAAAGTSFAWKIDAYGRKMYGFDLLDGKQMREQRTEGVGTAAEQLQDGSRHTTMIEVRRGSLRGLLDGQEIVKWSGDFNRLSMESSNKLPNPRALGIGTFGKAVIFHKVIVREVSGSGKLLRDVVPASASLIAPAGAALTFGGHRYQFVPSQNSWSEAKAKAEALGGHLAVITSQEELDWVVANFAKGKIGSSFHFWVGASKSSADAPWVWLTGETPAEKLYHHSDVGKTSDKGSFPARAILLNFRDKFTLDDLADEPPPSDAQHSTGFLVEWDDTGSTSATMVKFPPGQWVKVFTSAEDAREALRISEFGVKFEAGWFTGSNRKMIALPTHGITNIGVRARFRRERTGDANIGGTAGISLRSASAEGLRYQFKMEDRAASCIRFQSEPIPPLFSLPSASPLVPGAEYVMEFGAVGERLIGRSGDTLVKVATDALYKDDLAFIAGKDDVGDIEVINLDGLPEAEALRLLGVDEKGNDVRGKPGAVTSSPASTQKAGIDLLPYVDVKRDAVKGTWSVKPDGVVLESTGGFAALELPYEPPEEYDVEVELTPVGGTHNANIYLAAAGTSFAWKIDAHGRKLYGFDMLDGKLMPQQRTEGVAEAAERLQDGKRYTTTIEVRRGSLRGLLDGREMVKWSGNLSRLSMESGSKLPNPRALGIGSFDRAVIFHKVTVREVSGSGKLTRTLLPASASLIAPTGSVPQWQNIPWTEAQVVKEGLSVRDGNVLLDNNKKWLMSSLIPDASFANGCLRVTARFMKDARDPQLILLARTGTLGYHSKVTPSSAILGSYEGATRRISEVGRAAKLPPIVPGEEMQLEFALVGDTLRTRINGTVVVSAKDSRNPATGLFHLQGMEVLISKVEVLRLDGVSDPEAALGWQTAKMVQPKGPVGTTSSSTFPPGQWVKVFTKPEELPDVLRKPDSGVKYEDGWILPPQNAQKLNFSIAGFSAKNMAIRARVRCDEGDKVQSLFVRGSSDLSKSADHSYGIKLQPGDSTKPAQVQFQVFEQAKNHSWRGLNQLSVSPDSSRIVSLELATVGDQITARVNGRLLGTTKDASPPGDTALCYGNLPIRDIEVINLDGLPEAEALRILGVDVGVSAPLASGQEPWLDTLQDPSSLGFVGEVKRSGHTLSLPTGSSVFVQTGHGPKQDGAVRVSFPFSPAKLSLRVRSSAASAYQLFAKNANTVQLERWDAAGQTVRLGEFSLRSPLKSGDDCRLEFRIVGDLLTAMQNGEVLGSIKDATLKDGRISIGSISKDSQPIIINSLEVLNLDGQPEAETSAPIPIPGLPNLPPLTVPPGGPGLIKTLEIKGLYLKETLLLPDNRRMLAFPDSAIALIDLETGAQLWTQKSGTAFGVSLSKDGGRFVSLQLEDAKGKRVGTQTDGRIARVSLHETATGRLIQEWTAPTSGADNQYSGVALSPSGKSVVIRVREDGATGSTFLCFDEGNPKPAEQWSAAGHKGYTLHALSETEFLSTGSAPDKTARDAHASIFMRRGSGGAIAPFLTGELNYYSAVSKGGKWLVASRDSRLAVWDMQAKKFSRYLGDRPSTLGLAMLGSDRILMNVVSPSMQQSKELGIWDLVSGNMEARLAVADGSECFDTMGTHPAPNGTFAVVRIKHTPAPPGGETNTLKIWRLPRAGTQSSASTQHEVTCKSTLTAAATKDAPFVNTLGMKFVPVPITGGPTSGKRVLFSIWETRVQDWAAYNEESKRGDHSASFLQGPTHPVVKVPWEDARVFCQWLTARERKAGRLGPAEEYRLPSDHEWSCAAGIGDREDPAKSPEEKDGKILELFPWGAIWPPPVGAGNLLGQEAFAPENSGQLADLGVKGGSKEFRDGFLGTAPVGSFQANPLGLHDLAGNVEEWCEGWWNGDQSGCVVRGSGWTNYVKAALLSATRRKESANQRRPWVGFRCVLAPAP